MPARHSQRQAPVIGQRTPPSGVIPFLIAQLARAPLNPVFRETPPITLAMITILLVTHLPLLSLRLPGVLIR